MHLQEYTMKVMVSGSHGLIGSALCRSLTDDGHHVTPLSRNFNSPIDFTDINAVIHLAGENIASGRWNTEKKERILKSRVEGTTALSKQIANSDVKPTVFISASAIGYYGDRSTEDLDENSTIGDGFLPTVCEHWESSTQVAHNANVRTVHLRTGIVLSKEGGALAKMLTPFRLGAGGIIGNGKQYMSWISIDDMVGAIRFIIENESIHGPVNLVSPSPVTNRDFTKTLGGVLRRPSILPLPAFAARMMLGEMADALLLSSAKVYPRVLLNNGYAFIHSDLRSALEDIL
jgi:uncharacterized protein (TIGR01777 family)